MKSAKFQWQRPEDAPLDENFKELIQPYQLSPLVGKILWQRGIRTAEAVAAFFNEDLTALHDPYLMHDMQKAVERIQQAILAGERILIYGDYDADGITSTTLMKETLELLGADVVYFLPNRFEQGYGPNPAKYEEFIEDGLQLIITVDNGVSGHEAIALAQSRGVDVIVTDHHELPAELPAAYAIVHPKHPQGNYPFPDLAGVGVAFKVATALLEEPPYEFLDLTAIGTIADLVSLTDENRLLVKAGLAAIKGTERMGLLALLEKSGVAADSVDETSIGFAIGPRLNAIGRLGDPNPAVELLTTFEEEKAQSLAAYLDEQNTERKAIVAQITAEALTMVDPANEIQLLAKEEWHEGVLGIVAGNVMQQTGQPAIVLTKKPDGTVKGSGRSTEQLNLFAMLDSMRELFCHFGGHHAAVGLTATEEQLPEIQQRMNQYIEEQGIALTDGALLKIDEVLQTSEVSVAFIQSLQQLAPFGTDNPLPAFLFENIQPHKVKVLGAQQQHLKFAFDEADSFEAIAFNFGGQAAEFSGPLDVVGQLAVNEWNGRKKPQLQLQDFCVDGIQFFDWRAKRFWQQELDSSQTLFLAFSEASRRILPPAQQAAAVLFESAEQIAQLCREHGYQQVAVLDIPEQLADLKAAAAAGQFSRIYLYAFTSEEAYLNGMGSREQYGKLFKVIKNNQKIDVRYKLDQLAQFLQIPKSLLVFMIKVFSELKFVTIEDGVLTDASVTEKQELTASAVYQKRLQQIKNEEFLLLADSQQIKTWLLS